MTSLIKGHLPARMLFMQEDDLEESTFLLYAWVLDIIKTQQIGQHLNDYIERSGSNLQWSGNKAVQDMFRECRQSLFHSFDMVRLKLATLKAVIKRIHSKEEARFFFLHEGLPADCADLYIYLLKDKFFWKLFKERVKALLDPQVMKDIELNPAKLIHQCNEDFRANKLDNRIRHACYKRIRFIANAHNESMEWLEGEVRMAAVAYYYKVRPLRSRLHAINYVKSSINDTPLKIIAHYTKPENARLREETGSWKNPGNTVVLSTGDIEKLAMIEMGNGGLSWADMCADSAD